MIETGTAVLIQTFLEQHFGEFQEFLEENGIESTEAEDIISELANLDPAT